MIGDLRLLGSFSNSFKIHLQEYHENMKNKLFSGNILDLSDQLEMPEGIVASIGLHYSHG